MLVFQAVFFGSILKCFSDLNSLNRECVEVYMYWECVEVYMYQECIEHKVIKYVYNPRVWRECWLVYIITQHLLFDVNKSEYVNGHGNSHESKM